MKDFNLRDKCSINTNYDTDTFVGIKCENGDYSICFPLGFQMSESDRQLRKDILLLLNSIKETTMKKESEVYNDFKEYSQLDFPFQAYLALIYDYYNRGYYHEIEVIYNVSKRGKIDWNRTIKTQKPSIQDGQAFYLDFVTKRNSINENELITLIHEYCVFDSFEKIGWLFTDKLPSKPRLKFNYKLFKSVIREKLERTFNDKNKKLFRNMLAIIDYEGENNEQREYKYGTNRFEYVWESMIDRVFGIEKKEQYFPKTTWTLSERKYDNASLEPDTIMIVNNDVYVLDAKYYKYGVTRRPWDLPESTSINKQITYGEYIAEETKFKKIHGENFKTYNVFLMPYNMEDWKATTPIKSIGKATSSWKHGCKEYETIIGVLIDVKHLMKISSNREDQEEMLTLANVIDSNFIKE